MVRRDSGPSGVQVTSDASVAAVSRFRRCGARTQSRAGCSGTQRTTDPLLNLGRITFVILTLDASESLPDALASLPPGANVLVLDAGSNDDTVAVARRAGATVLERRWTNFIDARTFALDNVRSPWTFMLDADEQLDGTLREALFHVEPEAAEIEGFRVRRETRFCGEVVRAFGWDKEMILRMFRTDRGVVAAHPVAGGSAALHERWSVPGNIADLDGVLFHDSYPDSDAYTRKYARYTSIEAEGLSPNIGRLAVSALIAPLRFAWLLGPRGGMRLGKRGVYIAFWSALYQTIVRWKALRRRA